MKTEHPPQTMNTKTIKLTKAQGLFLLDCIGNCGAYAVPSYGPMKILRGHGFIKEHSANMFFITPTGKQHLETLAK